MKTSEQTKKDRLEVMRRRLKKEIDNHILVANTSSSFAHRVAAKNRINQKRRTIKCIELHGAINTDLWLKTKLEPHERYELDIDI